jgi:hypothetical protein
MFSHRSEELPSLAAWFFRRSSVMASGDSTSFLADSRGYDPESPRLASAAIDARRCEARAADLPGARLAC